MDQFEYKNGNLYHTRAGELVAVVAAENVAEYQKFVPDAPLPELNVEPDQAG
jgi:hypothetical protein